jgi:hypothetical protein
MHCPARATVHEGMASADIDAVPHRKAFFRVNDERNKPDARSGRGVVVLGRVGQRRRPSPSCATRPTAYPHEVLHHDHYKRVESHQIKQGNPLINRRKQGMFATRENGGEDCALWPKTAKFSVSVCAKRVLFTPLAPVARIFCP